MLNACDTGRGSAADVFSSTAAALIRREIPAVVAMQFGITDSAAILFAQTLHIIQKSALEAGRQSTWHRQVDSPP